MQFTPELAMNPIRIDHKVARFHQNCYLLAKNWLKMIYLRIALFPSEFTKNCLHNYLIWWFVAVSVYTLRKRWRLRLTFTRRFLRYHENNHECFLSCGFANPVVVAFALFCSETRKKKSSGKIRYCKNCMENWRYIAKLFSYRVSTRIMLNIFIFALLNHLYLTCHHLLQSHKISLQRGN